METEPNNTPENDTRDQGEFTERLEKVHGQTKKLSGQIDFLRLQVKYLLFDVEATRRERDYYKALAETGFPPEDSH